MKVAVVFIAPDGRVRATWRALIFLPVFVALTVVLATLVFTLLGPTAPPAQQEHQLLFGGLVAAPAAALAAWWLLVRLDRRSFRNLGLWFYDGWGRELAIGLAAGVAMITAVAGLLALLGQIEFQARDWDGLVITSALGWNLLLFFPPAAFEELLFRGYPFQRLVEGWGAMAAVLALSALFGLGHLQNPAASVLSTVNTVLIGILLALAYLKTRGLWLPIGLHYAWNFWLGFVVSLPVSGIPISHRLFHAEARGPAWLTGGAYGLEGSALTTLVVLAATLWLARTARLRISPALEKELQ